METVGHVALNQSIPATVAFIIAERARTKRPVGTGFLVGVRTPEDPKHDVGFTTYLVTAAHVVRGEPETWVRLRRHGGLLEDITVSRWRYHERDDVAVARLELDEADTPFNIALLPIPDFLPSYAPYRHEGRTHFNRPMLGDTVYFVGLFAPIPMMGEQNVPLVRSGTLAAIAQEQVPLKLPDGTVLHYTAHLIDCRAYRGFSGSPCFVQFPRAPSLGGVGREGDETELLGLISSHFDYRENAELTGEIADIGTVGIPVHLGVGVVMPAESIEELLDEEDVVEDRQQYEAKHRSQ